MTREDGTEVSLHPNWSKNKVESKEGVRDADREVPKTGIGGSSGPAHLNSSYRMGVDKTLKFDSKRSNQVRHSGEENISKYFVYRGKN